MVLPDRYIELINEISKMNEVLSIGKSGGEKLPEANEGDVDIFVFCSEVPDAKRRRTVFAKSGASLPSIKISEKSDRYWGVCDFAIIEDTEIYLMYFTTSDMDKDIESVLSGSRLDKEDGYFYPTGRCATFLSMHALYDKGNYITTMKEKLSRYPRKLAQMLYDHHIGKINDAEDFSRAVSNGDVLFYHAILESGIDHFLQALFALNHCFFPSRKRTMKFIDGFRYKPENFAERLSTVIALGSKPETLAQSYDVWNGLCKEILS